jgi:TfoX/Sxy family transcriptional regulator of competence genes
MASDAGFVQHVCGRVRGIGELSHRKMFGEYAVYLNGKVVALVCDNQLFLKPTGAVREMLGTPREAPPYPGARPYFLVDDVDDGEQLALLFAATAAALPAPRPKTPGKPRTPRPKPG